MSAKNKKIPSSSDLTMIGKLNTAITSFESMKTIILIRNGERCDRVFPEWLTVNITNEGLYKRTDLNLPDALFNRPEGIQGYINDTPITEVGALTSKIIGSSLRMSLLWPINRIYCSPALRSIQSAFELIRGTKQKIELCVEPKLYDFLGWYESMPTILSLKTLERFKIPVNLKYKALMSVESLSSIVGRETISQFNERIKDALNDIVNRNKEPEHILIITHAPVIDAVIKTCCCSSSDMITELEMLHMGAFYPYSSVVAFAKPKEKWSFINEPIPPLTYLGVSNQVNTQFIEKTMKFKEANDIIDNLEKNNAKLVISP